MNTFGRLNIPGGLLSWSKLGLLTPTLVIGRRGVFFCAKASFLWYNTGVIRKLLPNEASEASRCGGIVSERVLVKSVDVRYLLSVIFLWKHHIFQ